MDENLDLLSFGFEKDSDFETLPGLIVVKNEKAITPTQKLLVRLIANITHGLATKDAVYVKYQLDARFLEDPKEYFFFMNNFFTYFAPFMDEYAVFTKEETELMTEKLQSKMVELFGE